MSNVRVKHWVGHLLEFWKGESDREKQKEEKITLRKHQFSNSGRNISWKTEIGNLKSFKFFKTTYEIKIISFFYFILL